MNRSLFALVFTLVALAPVYSQVFPLGNCTISASVPLINVNGESELVSDAVMTCTSTAPSASILVNITLSLNTDLTSRLMNPVTMDSEALLLIDEPQPGVPNSSNGFPYTGQVLGASGIAAGAPGSGNVYQAKQTAVNQVTWFGVPYVSGAPGTMRVFRMTNIRANPVPLGAPGAIVSALSITGPTVPIIVSPINNLAQSANGFSFSSSVPASPVGTLDLQIGEMFPNAFLKRIENTFGGPLTATFQDVPGVPYCTQSGFTPEFGAVTPGAIGSANTGTRFLVAVSRIPHHIAALTVPIEVTSSSTKLVAHLVFPPLGADFAGGTVLSGGGSVNMLVSAAHSVDLLYEVTAAPPFNAINACAVIDGFNFQAIAVPASGLHAAIVKFHMAPIDPTATASATAPEPRFIP